MSGGERYLRFEDVDGNVYQVRVSPSETTFLLDGSLCPLCGVADLLVVVTDALVDVPDRDPLRTCRCAACDGDVGTIEVAPRRELP